MIKLTCQTFLTHPVADFCTLGFDPSPIGLRWPHPRGRSRWFLAYRDSDQTNLLDLPHSPSGRFLHPWFRPLTQRNTMAAPRERPRCIKLTCQTFQTHPVADFCTLGFAPSPIGPRWSHPSGRSRWFSAYWPDPWLPVIKLTWQTFLTHSVPDFCTLVVAPSPIGPRWLHPRGWPTWFSAYRPYGGKWSN